MASITRQKFKIYSSRRQNKLGMTISYAILTFLIIIVIFPFFWMLRTALAPLKDAFSLRPGLLPSSFTLDNLIRVVTSENVPFLRYFQNTLVVSATSTFMVLVAGTWGAYALARLDFRGKRVFGFSLLIIQMFPGVLLVIPLYVVLSKVGLTNSHVGLAIALTTTNLPFVTWLLRGYFLSIPRELEDAARIDGCTYFGALWRIVLPLAASGVVATATLAFINCWNEFLIAYVLIDDNNMKVLSTGLASYTDSFTTDYTGLFAMATLTTLPVILAFMFFQRYLAGGLTAGSVKG